MKFYNSVGPNPRVVRVFMAELGVSCDVEEIDIMKGVNRQSDYLAVNPGGQLPALMLDDGRVVSEITAICEYFADQAGGSTLIGETPEDRAETRMWVRRIDLNIVEPLANGFRASEGYPMFKDRMRTFPQAADDLKALAQDAGRQFVCGDRFSLADILLVVFLEFGAQVGQPINDANTNVKAIVQRVQSRESMSA
jgi:glutathione S-transferase